MTIYHHGIRGRGEFNMVINHGVMEHKTVPWQIWYNLHS